MKSFGYDCLHLYRDALLRFGAQRKDYNAIGLARRDEKDWLVVVADITNWTDADASLTLRDIRVRFPESDTLVRAAPNSSKAAAEALVDPAAVSHCRGGL